MGLPAQIAGPCDAVGIRERRRGVAVLHEIVFGLAPVGIARQPQLPAERGKLPRPAGDDLVDV